MLQITPNIKIKVEDLKFSFIRSSGPGGQNINKVSTAVQLKFDINSSKELSDEIKVKLFKICGRKISTKGVLLIEAKRFRTQEKNKSDAIERFIAIIKKAAIDEKPRHKTKPSKISEVKRIENKKRNSQIKQQRKKIISD